MTATTTIKLQVDGRIKAEAQQKLRSPHHRRLEIDLDEVIDCVLTLEPFPYRF